MYAFVYVLTEMRDALRFWHIYTTMVVTMEGRPRAELAKSQWISA
ncbi:hypothetical protein F6453_0844 [Marinobacter nauticus]|uniref:Uncharacterized protein n=1 Tax=Marinobacter nauticus TaxID=2743 RepID=A0A833JSS8_MARNT|nr:hypothetical protein F6453_0844 [Marinobacter nauticus]